MLLLPHHQAGELLLHVPVLVGGLGRAESCKTVAAIFHQPARYQVQRLVPGRLSERPGETLAVADQRRFDAVGVLGKRIPEAALDAQHPHAGQVVGIVVGCHDAVGGVVNFQLDAAANAAVRAGGADGVGRCADGRRLLDADGPGGAHAQALAAGGADAFGQRFVAGGGNAGRFPSPQHIDGPDELVRRLAGIDATGAQDTGVHRQVEHRVGRIGSRPLARLPPPLNNPMQLRRRRQLPIPVNPPLLPQRHQVKATTSPLSLDGRGSG